MTDGNSGTVGVGDGEGDEVTVGVAVGVGVGVLPTLKVARAVATVTPFEASTATAEVAYVPLGPVELILNCVLYVPAVPVTTVVLYASLLAELYTWT